MGGRLFKATPPALVAIVFLDMLSVGLVVPLMPYLVRSLGGSDMVSGLMQSVYGGFQVLGSLVMGRYSDVLGRRPVLALSLVGAMAGYLMGALAPTTTWLLLSRVPVGLLKQTGTVAAAIAVDCSGAERRVQSLSWVSAVASTAMVVGPPLAGALTEATGSTRLPAFVATGMYLVAVGVLLCCLPETAPRHAPGSDAQKFPPAQQTLALLRAQPAAALLLAARFLVDLAFLTHQATSVQSMQTGFDLGARDAGLVVSAGAAVHVATRALLLPALAARVSPRQLVLGGVGLVSASLAAQATMPHLAVFLVTLPPLLFGYDLCATSLMAAATNHVPPEAVGTLAGAADTAQSVCRIVCPLMGSWALTQVGPAGPSALASLAGVGALVVAGRSSLSSN